MTDHTLHRSLHVSQPVTDREGKLKQLRTWKHWRKYGLRGNALEKRTRMDLRRVRQLAAELDFDLEGLA